MTSQPNQDPEVIFNLFVNRLIGPNKEYNDSKPPESLID